MLKGNSEPFTPAEMSRRGRVDLSDPDSRGDAHPGHPPRQAYKNARAAVNDRQIVLAAEISISAPDWARLWTMLDIALSGLREQGIEEITGAVPR